MKACFGFAAALLILASAAATPLSAQIIPTTHPPGDKTTNPLGLPFLPKGQRGYYNREGGPTATGPGETVPYKTAQEQWEALKKAAHGGRRLSPAELPNWSGIWDVADPFADFDPALAKDASDYGPLSAEGHKYYDQVIKNEEADKDWDPLSACLPNGWPRFITSPHLKDFALTPDVVYMMNEQTAETRRIYMDRDHRPDDESYPLWEGDSIGFWDGSGDSAKLVVWTNGVRANVLQRSQPRTSTSLETIEVYTKPDAEHINLDIVLYDPIMLTRPWLVHRHYIKNHTPHARIDMWVCAEDHAGVKTGPDGGTTLALPTQGDPLDDLIFAGGKPLPAAKK